MKKINYILLFLSSLIILSSCSSKGCDLLILNWGDYICDDIIVAFEEEYNCNVKVATTDSNESMYSKILNRNAEYDYNIIDKTTQYQPLITDIIVPNPIDPDK